MDDRSSNKQDLKDGSGITAGRDATFGDTTGQLAIGDYINQFKIEKPSGEDLFKLITFLDQKRKEESNKEILGKYNPSEIPDFPPQLKEFVTYNRADEITKAITYLQDHRILLINGIGGVGKTILARALIETRPANVPLPFWFDFGKKQDAMLGDVLEKLAAYLKAPDILIKIEGKDADQKYIDRFTGELQKRKQIWLVFDNLETLLKDDRKFHDEGIDLLFTSLRGSSHNAKIIVTSRALPELKNGKELIDAIEKKQMKELEGLSNPNAVYYLEKNGFEDVDKQALEKVAEDVDGHPLALELLVGIANDMGVSNALKEIKLYRKEKLNKIIIQRRLFEKLAGEEKELLERISVFRKPEPLNAFKIMMTGVISVENLRNLLRKSLLKTDKTEHFWLHPLVREFAYDDLQNKTKVHEIAMQYYLSLPLPEPRMKKEDVQPLIEAHYHACRAENYNKAFDIIMDNNIDEDLDRWGNSRTLIDLYLDLLPDDHFNGTPLLEDPQIHGVVLGNLGLAYSDLGQVETAIDYYQKALKITQEISDRQGEGTWLGNLGNAYRDLGQDETAIDYYQKALKIAQEISDRRNEGTWLGGLGNAYRGLGQVEKAIDYYQKALKIAQQIGDRRNEGNCLGGLGNAYRDLGQVETAIEYYQEALKIAQKISDRQGEGTDLGNLGSAYGNLGQVEMAIEYYKKALKIAQQIGDRRGEGNWLGNIGNAYSDLGQVETAIEYYQKALAIAKEIKDPRIINFCEEHLRSIQS